MKKKENKKAKVVEKFSSIKTLSIRSHNDIILEIVITKVNSGNCELNISCFNANESTIINNIRMFGISLYDVEKFLFDASSKLLQLANEYQKHSREKEYPDREPFNKSPCIYCNNLKIGCVSEGYPTVYWLICSNCYARGPRANTLEEAVRFWDTRVSAVL